MAYKLELSEKFVTINLVFHICMLRKHVNDGDKKIVPDVYRAKVKKDTSYELDPFLLWRIARDDSIIKLFLL